MVERRVWKLRTLRVRGIIRPVVVVCAIDVMRTDNLCAGAIREDGFKKLREKDKAGAEPL